MWKEFPGQNDYQESKNPEEMQTRTTINLSTRCHKIIMQQDEKQLRVKCVSVLHQWSAALKRNLLQKQMQENVMKLMNIHTVKECLGTWAMIHKSCC